MTMGDRIAVLNDGRIQQVAPPDDTYKRPTNRFVAEFIGSPSMNMIEGTIEDGAFAADAADIDVTVPDPLQDRTTADRVTLGIRPEHVELTDADDDVAFVGEVDVVENLGNNQVVYFDYGHFEFLAEVPPGHPVTDGDEVGIRLPAEHLHLFDGTGPESQRVARAIETPQ